MGRNWAIEIGINHYDNLQSLSYAQRDAEALCDYFGADAGFEQVYYFSDNSPPIATNSGPPLKSLPTFGTLSRFLRVRFEEPFLSAGDNFWFFFAGHGKRHRDRDYLMPIDADPGNIEGTAIPINYVTERLRRCGADNVILILDACRNEGDRDGEGIGAEAQPGVVTLFGCSPSERSYEIEALQQGAFTHVLLQALRIQGEGDCATVERLYDHLRREVPQLNRRYQKPSQTPYTIAEPATKLHLILLPKQARKTDIATLKSDAQEAELEGDLDLAEQLWIRVMAIGYDSQALKAIQRIAVKRSANPEAPPPSTTPSSSTSRSRTTAAPVAPTPTPTPLPLPLPLSALRHQAPVAPTPTPTPLPIPSDLPISPAPQLPSFSFEVITVNAQGQETHRRPGTATYVTENLGKERRLLGEGKNVRLELVLIPGGTFQMGAPSTEAASGDSERPQHLVTVQPFLMGKYPITQAQWKAVTALPKVNLDLTPDRASFKGANRPVETVSWHEAVEFCARLSRKTGKAYRLPSEAEWEYACRAGTTTPFYFGETLTTDLANYRGTDWEYKGKTYPGFYGSGPRGTYRQQTTEVGGFPPNAWGLYDMHGNVWEWCLDHWHSNYAGASTDGSAWLRDEKNANRLLRGGSWSGLPRPCRSASRLNYTPDYASNNVGFRVVCVAPRTL